jgi:hypothetical protein
VCFWQRFARIDSLEASTAIVPQTRARFVTEKLGAIVAGDFGHYVL